GTLFLRRLRQQSYLELPVGRGARGLPPRAVRRLPALLVRRGPEGRALHGLARRFDLPASRRLTYRFVDCRWELGRPERGHELYLEGHVPGASFLDVEAELSAPPGGQDGGRHPLPAAHDFARVAGAAGIGPGVFVVAYDQGMSGGAARLWWLLRHFGHDDMAVLDGGIGAWLGPLRSGEEEVEPAVFVARPRTGDTIDADELLTRLGDERLLILDARLPGRYRG